MTGENQATAQDREDYQQLAAEHVIATEKLCAKLQIPAGARVLDIACGTGHAAIAAARRRAEVTGIDINEESLSRARIRASAEGLDNITFLNANAAAMPFADASFDYVVSSLGLVFLPDQEGAARELARVTRPDGIIALTAYTRYSLPSQVYDLNWRIFSDQPKPPRAHYEWSDGKRVGELLTPYFHAISLTYDSYDTCFASPAASFEHVSRWNPNIHNRLAQATKEQADQLRDGYIAILKRHNRATNGTFMANMDYAVITAVRSGRMPESS